MENLVTLAGMVGAVGGGLRLQQRQARAATAPDTAPCAFCAAAVRAALLTPFETQDGEMVALCRGCQPAHAAPGMLPVAAR